MFFVMASTTIGQLANPRDFKQQKAVLFFRKEGPFLLKKEIFSSKYILNLRIIVKYKIEAL